MLLQMMLFLEMVAIVTINPFALEEPPSRHALFPQGAQQHLNASLYSEMEAKTECILCLSGE